MRLFIGTLQVAASIAILAGLPAHAAGIMGYTLNKAPVWVINSSDTCLRLTMYRSYTARPSWQMVTEPGNRTRFVRAGDFWHSTVAFKSAMPGARILFRAEMMPDSTCSGPIRSKPLRDIGYLPGPEYNGEIDLYVLIDGSKGRYTISASNVFPEGLPMP